MQTIEVKLLLSVTGSHIYIYAASIGTTTDDLQ